MNPFVNPKKRSILLPHGCKDLVDVLRLPQPQVADPVPAFIRTVLLQAEGVQASELLIGAAMVHDGECIVTQRIKGDLSHVSEIPSGFRARVISELLRLAGLPAGKFPSKGVVCVPLKRRQLRWHIHIASEDAECILTPRHE